MSHTQQLYGQVAVTTHGGTLNTALLESLLIIPNFQREVLFGLVRAKFNYFGLKRFQLS